MTRFILFLLLFCAHLSFAQKKNVFQDVLSIVKETQKVISVKKGEKIDTTYFKTLFLPTARFTVVGEENGKRLHETMNLEAFTATLTDEYYSKGYFEIGKGQIIEEYNGIAQVIQSFYGKDSEGIEGWGLGSYQLIYSEGRWWIANMIWTMSSSGKEGIPKKYLKN
ncbi:hypothetical protein RQM59_08090 [Flavobacteriaceae bacterium S356]|uniref:Nuclear transport factor 2 family protein n=1 Tax=Asprobacillus argus TaxID=3076534 RepID=A0ABU3LGC5_9FLAO|nr:hypothetical protein [Flavobacteriaceae bacterium S356]